jgi:hypothetical protein
MSPLMSLPPSQRSAFVIGLLHSFCLPALPPGFIFARVVAPVGQVASLVSQSGAVLSPGAFRLVCSVSGAGGWLVLLPVQPAASQPNLF